MHFVDLKQALCTLVTVPVTPFDADGQVDLAAFRRVISRLTAGGIHAIGVDQCHHRADGQIPWDVEGPRCWIT